ncbi:MAG: DNA polymerase III subunit gamma/tau [Bacteroidia bacterium]|nr:DNA polymerase III subunit gamma/tau [Bacteroidia bacterium]
MDHFVVSARKYRPATFNTVVGQASITTTLKNAIKNKHLAQAFLFCGPRGVGKTTCARILAKTINCSNPTPDMEGCNECESCISFNNGQSLNIFELDAASNNSVDDMRNLVEQVRYAPQSGNFKIYIIDEVHMLSASAFNAFLKTLEEPPPYAIFILATTEKHKIIPTILSRCQIFDFNRITIEDIASHLAWISQKENVNAEPEALHLIAQKADGALRDALSIFDQIVSFAGNDVTYKHVIENLNILDYEYYFRLTDYLLAGDFPSALMLLNELVEDGFDIHHFVIGLSGHFRDLLVCKDAQTIQLLEVTPKIREKYLSQSKQCPAELLFRYLEIGNRCDIEFKASQNQRLHTELALLKMAAHSSTLLTTPQAITQAAPVTPLPVKPAPVAAPSPQAEKPASIAAPVAAAVQASAPVEEKRPVATEEKKEEVKSAPAPQAEISKPSVTKPAAPVQRKRATSGATVSINKNLNPQKKEDGDNAAAEEQFSGTRPIDAEEMFKVWKAFADKNHAEGRKQLAVALNKHQPILKDETHIEIPVDNAIQAEEIQGTKVELLAWMKKGLQNGQITISTRVVEETELKDTAYTPAEKFNKMAEKNPDLNQLRSQFDLELDF